METGNQPHTEKQAIQEIVHWIVVTALHDPRLIEEKGKLERELGSKTALAELVALGCDQRMLLNTLAFSSLFPSFYPPFTAEKLRRLADNVEHALVEMKTLTPSVALPFIEDSEDGTEEIVLSPTGGGMHVWPALETDLNYKVALYRQLATLCEKRLIPTRATIGRIATIWPVAYVNSSTGKPRYAQVSALLEHTSQWTNRKQLRTSFTTIKEQFPGITDWLALSTQVLQETAGYIS